MIHPQTLYNRFNKNIIDSHIKYSDHNRDNLLACSQLKGSNIPEFDWGHLLSVTLVETATTALSIGPTLQQCTVYMLMELLHPVVTCCEFVITK